MIIFINQINPIWVANRIKNNILLIIFLSLILQSCDSQSATKQIGDGLYDLDTIDFTIPLDTLAIKIPYNITLPLTSAHYDKELQKTIVTDTFAYQRKIKGLKSFRDKTSAPLFCFLDEDFKTDLVSFYLDKDENFVAFSFFESRDTPYDDILNNLQTKYKQYEVTIDKSNQIPLYGSETYKWKTSNRIIELVRTIKKYGGIYSCNISVMKSDIDLKKFPVDKIIGL